MSESRKTYSQVLLPSPNWYCSNVVSLSTDGLLAYGARSDVVFLQLNHETSNQDDSSSSVSRASVVSTMMMTRCHKDRVTFVRHADIDGLYTGGEDGKVKYWSISKRKCLSEHQEHKAKVTCGEVYGSDIVLSGDEKGNLICWNRQNSMFNAAKHTNSPVFSMSSCLERNSCAVGLKSGRIYLYDVIVHRITIELKGHDEEIHSLSWRPQAMEHGDNFALVSGSRDKTLRLWDLESGKCVAVAKQPGMGGGRPRYDKERIWTCTAWLSSGHIISSTPNGDLLSCVFSGKSSQWGSMTSESSKKHNRLVFSLTFWPGKNILISNSMDRNVIVWSFNLPAAALNSTSSSADNHFQKENTDDRLSWRNKSNHDTQVAQCQGYSALVLPTLGGYAYCVRSSPVDPGRLAVGVGDNLIRLWNVNEGVEEYSVSSVWQGLKSKVTAIAWHPLTENQLAYGTEDGRVGVFPALIRKLPIISDTYHQRMVYVISWGPPILSTGDVTKFMNVYSVGDGTIFIHNLTKDSHQPVQDLNKLISDVNSTIQTKIRSDITWTADYSKLIIGSEDGTVLILQCHDLKCLCTVKVCSKLVNALRVQPSGFLLAVGSNEHQVQIVDLTNLLRGEEDRLDQRLITDSVRSLKGHKSRVTDMCWNIHENSQLLTASYDGSAIIWNVKEGVVLSLYKKQGGHLLTCQWSMLDTDMVYTGSDEFSLHSWRPSDHIKQDTTKSETQTEQTNHNGETHDEIMRLLEEKKALLKHQELSAPDITEPVELKSTKVSAVTKSRRKNTKSYFPNMAAASKQDKSAELDDLISVYKCVTEGTSVTTNGKEHLGIFSPLLGDFDTFMEKEKFCLQADGSHDSAYQMMIWQGDVSEALETAANNKTLSDWLVNAASMLSFEHWIKYCRLYAQQLKGEGQTHKAALYLLYTHDVDEAVAWLVEASLYREALCIARSRYPVGCERITNLYKQWSFQIRKDANYDLAAKCLVTLEEPSAALAILNRRQDIQSALRAVEFGVMVPACHTDMHAIAEKLTRQCLVIHEYEQLEQLCKQHPSLQVYRAWCIVHRELEPVLMTGQSSRYMPGQILLYIRSKLIDEGIDPSVCVRGMAVSQMYIDQVQVRVDTAERILHAVSVLSQPDHTDQAVQDVLLQACVTLIASQWLEHSFAVSNILPEQILLLYHDDLQIWKLILSTDWKPSSCLSELALPIIYLWSAVSLTVWPLLLSHLPGSTEQTSHDVADVCSRSDNHEISNNIQLDIAAFSTGENNDIEMLKLTSKHVYEVVFLLCNGLTLHWLEPSSVQALISHCETLKSVKTQQAMTAALDHLELVSLLSYLDERNVCKLDRKSTKYVTVLLFDLMRKLSVITHSIHFTPHLPGQPEAETLISDWLNLHSVTNSESTSQLVELLHSE